MSGLTGSIIKSSLEKSQLGKFPTYDHADYDPKQPSNHNNFRPRDLNKETTTPLMKYTHKDEKERINDKIQGIPKLSTEVTLLKKSK
jgi:hypothetical protein